MHSCCFLLLWCVESNCQRGVYAGQLRRAAASRKVNMRAREARLNGWAIGRITSCAELGRGRYDHFVQGGDSIDGVWAELRATRWEPPGAASADSGRRKTYVFALEQAEQMMRAAVGVGTATRPLLVFYGLSQAGRAIAAAADVKGNVGWQLQGHGIHAVPSTLAGPLPSIRIRTDRRGSKGSFVKLSELLGSYLWEDSSDMTLDILWDCLPENRLAPLDGDEKMRRVPLWVAPPDEFMQPHPLVSVPVVYFPPWMLQSQDTRAAMTEYLESFPGAQAYDSFHRAGSGPDAAPRFVSHVDGWGELVMNWALPDERSGGHAEQLAFLKTRTRPYSGSMYFFPGFGTDNRDIHPLMAWWAVLYSLSMLARYHPAEWAEHIDVDRSRHAVRLENLLKQAIDAVPRLVIEAIEQLSNPTPVDGNRNDR